MPRPSQCYACGCFEACLYPEDKFCAERKDATVQQDSEVQS